MAGGFYSVEKCNEILRESKSIFDSRCSVENGSETFVTSSVEKAKVNVEAIVKYLKVTTDQPTTERCLEFLLKIFYLDDDVKVQLAIRAFAPEHNDSFLKLIHANPIGFGVNFLVMFMEYFDSPSAVAGSKQILGIFDKLTENLVRNMKIEIDAPQQLMPVWDTPPKPRAVPVILFKLTSELTEIKFGKSVDSLKKEIDPLRTDIKTVEKKVEALLARIGDPADRREIENLAKEVKNVQGTVQNLGAKIKALEANATSPSPMSGHPAAEVDLSKTVFTGQGHQILTSVTSPASFSVRLLSSAGEVVPHSTQFLRVKITTTKAKIAPTVSRNDDQGECAIVYTPRGRGLLTIKVKYKGAHLPGSPFIIRIPNTRPSTLIQGKPFGIAFARGSMFVSDCTNNCVTEFLPSGQSKLFKGGLQSPRGLGLTHNGEILVGDAFNNRVLVLSPEGKERLVIGQRGNGDGQFSVPRSALVLPDDSIVVCDTDNSRLQFFSKTGGFLRKIGSHGDGPLEFRHPLSVALNPLNPNEIAVADSDNHRVQFIDVSTFSYAGEIGKFDNPALNKTKVPLNCPNFVLYDEQGNLYVLELNGHCIKIFSPERTLLMTLGKEGKGSQEFKSPRSLAWAPDGSLCVADHENNRIVYL